jgi:hypothetical protein
LHRGCDQELVRVEFHQVADHLLHRRLRVQGRIGIALFEPVEDLTRVLPGLVLGGDHDRNKDRAYPPLDLGGIGSQLLVLELLVAESRSDFGREE